MNNYKQEHCSPLGSKNQGSCLNRKLLEKIARILNNNPNCSTIDCGYKTDLLHSKVCENIKKISKCNSEYCWITVHDIVDNLKSSEVSEFKKYFKPEFPSTWQTEPNKWLNTSDIDNVLKQYQDAHNNFVYMGAHPIDAHKCSVSDQVCSIDIEKLLKKGKEKIGIVFNTDDSTGPGEHWVSFYVDLKGRNIKNKPGIYFFDSTSDKPQQEVLDLVKKLKNQGEKIGLNLDFLYNDIRHQKKNTECGVYSIYFIVNMLKDINFKLFVKNIKRDDFMEKYRKIFYLVK